MQTWLLYGIVAAFCWGGYIILSKVVTGPNYYGINTNAASLMMLIGIAIVFVGYFFINGIPQIPSSIGVWSLGILVGILWALGMVFAFIAIASGADVSRLNPIYNTNTLIAVILAIVFLREIPQGIEIVKVLAGAILITTGAILVSK